MHTENVESQINSVLHTRKDSVQNFKSDLLI